MRKIKVFSRNINFKHCTVNISPSIKNEHNIRNENLSLIIMSLYCTKYRKVMIFLFKKKEDCNFIFYNFILKICY